MATLENKIDFVMLITVDHANPNGDPLNGNRPRLTDDGFGEISDVCIKRKIRNRWMEMGESVFVQSDENKMDGYASLRERADSNEKLSAIAKDKKLANRDDLYAQMACESWLDVRAFGQVFAFKNEKKGEGVSIGIRGPISIQSAFSVGPVEIESLQITKSVNNEPGEKKGSDTMGAKHRIAFGLYLLKGSINVQLAEKTGFSVEDAEKLKKALISLFTNDSSSARPEGSINGIRLYWFRHNSKLGQYSPAKVHGTVIAKVKDGVLRPRSLEDYSISYLPLPGLEAEIIEG